ncbi:MAG: nicotinamide-nucleotide adenylyltransferase [Candidatus Thermoplasmatota archaeon]
MSPERPLFVGRFQPFHLGHLDMVRRIVAKHGQIIIGIGSAQYSHTGENPFTASERYEMIKRALDAEGIHEYHIVPIPDTHVHSVWVSHVLSLVPKFDVVYTNSPLVVRLFRERGLAVVEMPLHKREVHSGTAIRKRIFEGGDWIPFLPKEAAAYILEIDGPQRIRETFRYSTPYGTRENEAD